MFVCFEDTATNYFVLENPGTCANVTAASVTSFKADVYAPPPSQKEITAWSCSYINTEHQWTMLFFGTSIHTVKKSSLVPVPPAICRLWAKQKSDNILGTFIQDPESPDTFVTSVAPIEAYSWMRTTQSIVKNAVVSKTVLSFNLASKEGLHAFDSHLTCDAQAGTCQGSKTTYIFDRFDPTCHHTRKSLAQSTTVNQYAFDQGETLQIPALNLAFTSLTECPEHWRKCFPQYSTLGCTRTNYVLGIHNSSSSFPTEPDSDLPTRRRSHMHGIAPVITQAFVSAAIETNDQLYSLRNQILTLECESARLHLASLRAAQHIQPSSTLSTILNRKVFAAMGNDALQELACHQTTATLMPSLWVGDRLAARPIFRLHFNGEVQQAQWTSENYLRIGLMEFTSPTTSYQIFRIENITIVFQNGTLVQDHIPQVRQLGLRKSSIHNERTVPDPYILAREFKAVASPQGLNSLHSTVEALVAINAVQLAAHGIDPITFRSFSHSPLSAEEGNKFMTSVGEALSPTYWSHLPSFSRILHTLEATYTIFFTILILWLVIAWISRSTMKWRNRQPTKL